MAEGFKGTDCQEPIKGLVIDKEGYVFKMDQNYIQGILSWIFL